MVAGLRKENRGATVCAFGDVRVSLGSAWSLCEPRLSHGFSMAFPWLFHGFSICLRAAEGAGRSQTAKQQDHVVNLAFHTPPLAT